MLKAPEEEVCLQGMEREVNDLHIKRSDMTFIEEKNGRAWCHWHR